ncbi:MAG: hypothetical protein ACXVRK_14885 [Gaiellaceae bacterium]
MTAQPECKELPVGGSGTCETIGAGRAARMLEISREYLRQLAIDGRIPCQSTPYGRVFALDDVERLRLERIERAAKVAA